MELALFWATSSVEPEEGRFNVWNQTFTDGDPKKTAVFHSFFPHVLEVAQPDYTRKDSTALGIIRTLSRIFFTIYPWLEQETSTVTLTSSITRRIGPFRVITSDRPDITHGVIGVQDEKKNVPFPGDQCYFF